MKKEVVVGLIKERKKSIFRSWIFWVIALYFLVGIFIHFTSSIAIYNANEPQYELFVKCVNNETMNKDEIYTCNNFKEWGLDMEGKVAMGKGQYLLSVSGIFKFERILTWPLMFLMWGNG